MRTLPDPGFAGDDGRADPAVTAALAAYHRTPTEQYWPALHVLQDSRVLVPVVAVLGEVEYDDQGLAHDKTSDMAAVLITGKDGRTALLAFTGAAPMAAWRPDARPVPVPIRQAARAALDEDAGALLVDVAGPAPLPIEGSALECLAAGHRLVRLSDARGNAWGWAQQ